MLTEKKTAGRGCQPLSIPTHGTEPSTVDGETTPMKCTSSNMLVFWTRRKQGTQNYHKKRKRRNHIVMARSLHKNRASNQEEQNRAIDSTSVYYCTCSGMRPSHTHRIIDLIVSPVGSALANATNSEATPVLFRPRTPFLFPSPPAPSSPPSSQPGLRSRAAVAPVSASLVSSPLSFVAESTELSGVRQRQDHLSQYKTRRSTTKK